MLRGFVLFVFALCLAYPAWSSEPAKKVEKPEPGTAVEMPYLMVPMTKDGDLVGYTYIASKLICTSPPACIRVREKLAFVQDAFVRDVNAKPLPLASDPHEIDKDALNARLTAAAKRIVGGNTVRAMKFIEIRFAPLHPSDSTTGVVSPSAQTPATATSDGVENPDGSAKNASSAGATSKPAAEPSH
jgi:hypothetical protein